jgi:hypothetical protein
MATSVEKLTNGTDAAALSMRGVIAWQFRSFHTGESIQDMTNGNLQFACDSSDKEYKECQQILERIEAAVRAKRPTPFNTQLI